MLNLLSQFAHAGEAHTNSGEGFFHLFESASFALSAWVFLVSIILALTLFGFKLKRANSLLILAFAHLAYGGFLYDKSPGVGALVVSVGFAATLIAVLVGLQNDQLINKKKE